MERLKLTVKEVLQPRTFPGKEGKTIEVYQFTGADLKKYETFSKSISEKFVIGALLDCDVETKTREVNGNTYHDYKITQLYENGQPVAGQKPAFGGFRGKSPEEQAIERKSIESQVAAKLAVDLMIAGKASVAMTAAVSDWIMTRLGVEITKAPPKAAEQEAKPADKPVEVPYVAPTTFQINALKKANIPIPEGLTRAKASELLNKRNAPG
jgi:hypothetical protein